MIELNTLQNNILSYIKSYIGISEFNSWFSDVAIHMQDHIITIYVKSQFIKDWIESNYCDILNDICYSKYNCRYHILIKTNHDNHDNISSLINLSMSLDPKMNFSTFIVGDANQMAFQAAEKVSNNLSSLNPLFIYGSSGCGKTHLLQSIMHELCKTQKKIFYISAEEYMMLFIKALHTQTSIEFKNIIRNIDIFCIEDLQFISRKQTIQKDLLYHFTYLISRNKQIIISADRAPYAFHDTSHKFLSKLSGGFTVQIKPASYELRLHILQDKTKSKGKHIQTEVLEFIAHTIVNSIRELEGALMRLLTQVECLNLDLTLQNAQSILTDIHLPRNIVIHDIISHVLNFYQINEEDLFSKSRVQQIVTARQIIMLLCREMTKKSLIEIAKIFGNTDHTKVLYSIKKIKEKCINNSIIAENIQKIKFHLNQPK